MAPTVPGLYAVLFSAGGRTWLEKGLGIEYVAKVAAVYEGLDYQTRLLIGPAMNAFGRETWYDLGAGRPLSEALLGRDNPANIRIADAACMFLSEAAEILSNDAKHMAKSSPQIIQELLPRFRFRLQHPNVDIEVAFAAAAALMPGGQLGASGAAAVPGLPPPPLPSMTSLHSGNINTIANNNNNNKSGNQGGGATGNSRGNSNPHGIGHGGGNHGASNGRHLNAGNSSSAATPGGRNMADVQCRVCKTYGHMKVDCPQNPLNQARFKSNVAASGGAPQKTANRTRVAPVIPGTGPSPRDAPPGPGKPCWRCGQLGHTKKTCPEMSDKKRFRKENDGNDDDDDDGGGDDALSLSPSQQGGGGDDEGWA